MALVHRTLRVGVNDVVTVAHRDPQHVFDAAGGMLQILVEGDDPVSGRVQNSGDRRRMLPKISRQMNDSHPFSLAGELIRECG